MADRTGWLATEVRHGPLSCATAETPLLVLRQNDGSSAMVDTLIADLRLRNLNVFSVGGPDGTLPWIGNDDPICDAITMLLPAYATIEQAAEIAVSIQTIRQISLKLQKQCNRRPSRRLD